jgi:class 3 adenylate cyclase
VRACYAALRMLESTRYSEGPGAPTASRCKSASAGTVVVRSIDSDVHMDYTAVGQVSHLAARMEQRATPGSIRLTADALRLAEGYMEVKALGAVPVKGLGAPVEVYEVTGAGAARSRLQAPSGPEADLLCRPHADVEQL